MRLRCPRCGEKLAAAVDELRCSQGHPFTRSDGHFDLTKSPTAGRSVSLFDGLWGRFYDLNIKRRRFAVRAARPFSGASAHVARRMYALMDEGITCEAGQTVIDVPCGGGVVLQGASSRLRGEYVGIDLSVKQLRRANRLVRRQQLAPVATLLRSDALSLPFDDASVDRILTFNGLHLIPNRAHVLAEFRRCLKPGGELLGSTLVEDQRRFARLIHPLFFCTRIVPSVTIGEWNDLMRDAGFVAYDHEVSGPLVAFRACRPAASGAIPES